MGLLLVRHGHTAWTAAGRVQGRRDVPLNLQGIRAAEALAVRLAAMPFHIVAVYSSPLSRSRRTADAVASAIGIGIVECLDDLIEVDFGPLEGSSCGGTKATRDSRGDLPSSGLARESLASVECRCVGTMQLLGLRHSLAIEDVVLVSHGGVIRALIGMLTGVKLRANDIEPASAAYVEHCAPGTWQFVGLVARGAAATSP